MIQSTKRFADTSKTIKERKKEKQMTKDDLTKEVIKELIKAEKIKLELMNLSELEEELEQRKKREITYLTIMFISVCLLFLYKLF
jgi:hypothetical protein